MTERSVHQTKQEFIDDKTPVSGEMEKKLETLNRVTRLLSQAGVDYVVGGSGMLFGLGLTDKVRDWDLMTEASENEIRMALDSLTLVDESGPSELYGSGCKLGIEETEPEVEIIVGFAIRTESGICRLPALPGGIRRGLRIASPEVWLAAYTLMGRSEKAALLEEYLQNHGADPTVLSRLYEEPLPAELAERLRRLPEAVV
ncbi:hypothetical protein [Saccharibacillus kuerlensis]|uniref:Uncharacterized protein n=1 Tax=Saccharibacillus kuerlensis TaxID=459527 RepID=A0ABQ2L583_9BACL|nr:hypothetical protein [Saccharibacillus kuerlensis]GGO03692.1 hypothetical protein GCM10010969_28110 [Saccharibacillus kuerlensis]